MSTVAANAMAQSLSPAAGATAAAVRDVQGTGGALFVAQLKAAGVKFVFFNPSTGDYPIFDALDSFKGKTLVMWFFPKADTPG